jgi:ribosomal protein L37AE/L43A
MKPPKRIKLMLPRNKTHVCDCGRIAVKRSAGSWQCARCLALGHEIDSFHTLTAGK